MAEEKEEGLIFDKKTMDVLVANIIPTSKYFEVRFDNLQQQIDMKFGYLQQQIDLKFGYLQQQMDLKFDHLQQQVDDVKTGLISLENRMNNQFEQIDKRFEQVDKRFEQIDKRFEQIDKRFEQIDVKLDKLIERVDVKIDAGLRENRGLTIKLFTFAMTFAAISMMGLLGKMLQIF